MTKMQNLIFPHLDPFSQSWSRLHAFPILYLLIFYFINLNLFVCLFDCFLFCFVFCLLFFCFLVSVYFYLFLSWVMQNFMQIHDFSIAFTEMAIQSVWLFILIVFSLLELPITYLPAIYSHCSPKKIPPGCSNV
jgi:hypothetical protein